MADSVTDKEGQREKEAESRENYGMAIVSKEATVYSMDSNLAYWLQVVNVSLSEKTYGDVQRGNGLDVFF